MQFLKWETTRTSQACSIWNDNYDIAVSILEEWYENIDYSHMNKFPSVAHKAKGLGNFLDKVETKLRKLWSVVMKCEPRRGYFELPEEELLQLEITKG